MNFFLLLIITLILSSFSFSQEKLNNISDESIERVPIFPGCNENLSNHGLQFCMSQNFSNIILKNFDSTLAKDIKTPEKFIKLLITFVINKNGEVENINTETPYSILKSEAIRVIKLFPKLTPGWQRGKFVSVPYSLPIRLEVNNDTKKQS